jgi:Zn-finger nucleic acid-binding protein
MKCPICKDINLVMSTRDNVEIDYCPECRGIWLDRGELDKIIEVYKGIENNNQKQYKNYNNDHHDNDHNYGSGHEQRYKKKSFLGNMFDF